MDDATAFAFKAGPPEGHAATATLQKFPDWRLSSGHAHPDAGGFIIFSNGKYLTGDSGYAGVPLTEHHNTLVFGGKGQAKEGAGHDAFAGVSYERLNKIRLLDVQMNARKVSLTAELTGAYEPEIGVVGFVRRFEFVAPNNFVVTDDVKLSKPQIVTAFLHSDNKIAQNGKNIFEFEPGGTSLSVEIAAPKNAETKIEKNILTAPGKPGSVDKGEREERGARLAVSTKNKVKAAKFVTRLKIKK